MEVVAPGQLPAPDHGGCAKVPFSHRTVWPWLKPWLQESEWDGDTRGVWEGQQRGLWAPAAEADCKKIQGSQLVQPSSKPASYSFYIISVQGGQTQSDLGTTEVCEERHRRSYCCPIHFSLTVLHGTDILGPFSPPRLHPALVPTGSSAAHPENRSEEPWSTLHGSWLFPLQLLPLPALVPRRQLSLSPSEEDNSNVVE